MGNTVAFQVDAFQNDAFQTYDIEIDVSGNPVKITRVHVMTKGISFSCMTNKQSISLATRQLAQSTFKNTNSCYAARRRKTI